MFRLVRHLINQIKKSFSNGNNIDWNLFTRQQTQPVSGFRGRASDSDYGSELHPQRRNSRKYTAQEVKQYLRGTSGGERARPVMAQAARINSLLDERMKRYFRGRERIFERLPFVLYQYTQGKPTFEIARSVSYFADGDDVEAAMDFASALIANAVNHMH